MPKSTGAFTDDACLTNSEKEEQIMDKSNNISWMPLFVIAAAAFVGVLDATFMNVSMSQVVIDLDTNVGTIQKMVSFYTLI